jgi:hypothetical protein
MKLLKMVYLGDLSLYVMDDFDAFFLLDFWMMMMRMKSSHVFELAREILWLKTEKMMMATILGVEKCKQFPDVVDGSVFA